MKKRFLKAALCLLFLVILITVSTSCSESKGLEFHLLENDTYEVIGIGECNDKKLVIPQTHEGKPVTRIDREALMGCDQIESVVIPDGVIVIDEYAFANCENLVEVTISGSVQQIGEYAFAGCEDFSKVNVTDLAAWCKIKFTDLTANPLHYAHGLYVKGKAVSELVIPDGVSAIGDYAFTGLNRIFSLTLPDSLTEIGDSAFFDCTRLEKITMGSNVTRMGHNVFSMCEKIPYTVYENGKYLGTEQNAYQILVQTADWDCTDFTIHENTKIIADRALAGCDKLTSITVPDSVTIIGNEAFDKCSKLESVVLGSGVESLGKEAFFFCEKLTSVTLSRNLESIGWHAFEYCMSLTAITIPEGVTRIDEGAFYACDKLTIYCKATSKPDGWHEKWKPTGTPVVWGASEPS